MTIYTYAEYSKLFKENLEDTLDKILSRANINYVCKVLSILGYYTKEKDDANIKKVFWKHFPDKDIAKYRKYLRNHVLVSRHGVLLAWKSVLEHRSKIEEQSFDEKQQIKDILMLILILQEKYMKEKEGIDAVNLAMGNAAYNYYDCQANQGARVFYIFIKGEKEVQEINAKFIAKYDMSIEDYILLTEIVVSYIGNTYNKIREQKPYLQNHWHFDKDAFLGMREEKKAELEKYLQLVSFSLQELEQEDEIQLLLSKCPFLEIQPGSYLPIERKLVQNLLFSSMLYKVNECYEKGDMSFWNQYGTLFQNYVTYIGREFCEKSQGKYSYIGEFVYGKPQKASPDIMIEQTMNDQKYVIVIEIKAGRLPYRFSDYMDISDDYSDNYVNKLVVEPIKQSFKAIKDIIEKKVTQKLNSEAEYLFLAVTAENFPYKESRLNTVSEEAKKYAGDFVIRDYNAISIEEFELLLQVLDFNRDLSFVTIFDRYRLDKRQSFKNLLRTYQTQKKNRNRNLLCNEVLYQLLDGSTCFDPVTNLGDECSRLAQKKYICSK